MRSRLMRIIALAVATSLLSTGCLLSRAVDRAFLGVTTRRPSYVDRKATGVFLIPITFAVDLATFPIQALLLVILGDDFPFNDTRGSLPQSVAMLEKDPRFQRLSDEQKAVAIAELKELLESGKLTKDSALTLTEDGHFMVTQLTPEAREQLMARLGQRAPSMVCER
ncbi:MAG: hypothetical protein AMXMBFR34_45720 [Myxococcaceae bacterium]